VVNKHITQVERERNTDLFQGIVELEKRVRGKYILTFENYRGVGSDQQRTGSGTTCGSCGTLGIDGNITGEDDGVSSVPGRGFDPVDSVEECSSGAVAGVFAVDTLDIIVARLCKKIHKGGLDGFGLVDDGLSADF